MGVTRRSVRQVPAERADCGWWKLLPTPPPARRLSGQQSADWAIIGAGICGLSVARQLAAHRPDDRIVLLDATRVGLGASGRNSGFILNYSAHGAGSGGNHDAEQRYTELLQAGVDELRRLVAELQIQCEWSDWGRLYVAVGDDGARHLDALAATHRRIGAETRRFDAAQCARLTGSEYYSAGLWAGGSALVQPAALVRGLADTLPANVTLHEESPVRSIQRDGGFRLSSDAGELRAAKLVIAAGSYAGELGAFRHRLLAIATYASMTRPLTPEERRRFGDTVEFGLLPASHNGSTVRLTRAGRIVMRNAFDYAGRRGISGQAEALSRAGVSHREAVRRRWPDLADIEIEHSWGGVIAYTRNQGALFGRIDDDVWAVVAGDAGPMARGAVTGKLLADLIVGADSPLLLTQLSLARAGLLPPEPILKYAVNRRLQAIRRDGAGEL